MLLSGFKNVLSYSISCLYMFRVGIQCRIELLRLTPPLSVRNLKYELAESW